MKMKREIAESIITSRLLVLQSKRLLLSSAERRLGLRKVESLIKRVDHLRAEVESAQHAYRLAVFAFGSPHDQDFWLVAYGRLIDVGRALTIRFREATAGMSAEERYEVSSDVQMLEEIVDHWTRSMRGAMSAAVA